MIFAADPIAARATASGVGAIAVIRISGLANDWQPLPKLVYPNRSWQALLPRQLTRAEFRDRDTLLDDGLIVLFPAPASYTGESMVELHLHGGPRIAESILRWLVIHGVRQAQPGEFTRRAMLNGKLTLPQAEAVNLLTRARTREAMAQAARRLRHGTQAWDDAREVMLRLLAHLEVLIDYPEEDLAEADSQQLKARWHEVGDTFAKLAAAAQRGRRFAQGPRVVLVGAPNAGKSSLLNRLVGEDRAIVSDIAGTTRDRLDVPAMLGRYDIVFVDTAGLRETEDAIEAAGVAHTQAQIAEADLLMHVFRGDAQPAEQTAVMEAYASMLPPDTPTLNVATHADRPNFDPAPQSIAVSSTTAQGITGLEMAIINQLDRLHAGLDEVDIPLSDLEAERIMAGGAKVDEARAHFESHGDFDVAALILREAIEQMQSLLGAITPDDVLDKLFGSFCVGK